MKTRLALLSLLALGTAFAQLPPLEAQDTYTVTETGKCVLAGLSIVALTGINVLGVVLGARTQMLLTVAKVVGLVALVVVGLCWGRVDLAGPADALQ